MQKYKYIILALLSCFGTDAYAVEWKCGYKIEVTSRAASPSCATGTTNLGTATINNIAGIINKNTKFVYSFSLDGSRKILNNVSSPNNKQFCSKNKYVSSCHTYNGADGVNNPEGFWECPISSGIAASLSCQDCPQLDGIPGETTRETRLGRYAGCVSSDYLNTFQKGAFVCQSTDVPTRSFLDYNEETENFFANITHPGASYALAKITDSDTDNYSFNTIESCYIPKDNEIHDASGTYIFTNDCYYQR